MRPPIETKPTHRFPHEGAAAASDPEAAVPLQGMHSVSKHAVKGFTDDLRVEVEEAGKDADAPSEGGARASSLPYS